MVRHHLMTFLNELIALEESHPSYIFEIIIRQSVSGVYVRVKTEFTIEWSVHPWM